MSITVNMDKDTILGFGKDVLTNIGKNLLDFIKSKEGAILISGLFSGTGIGAAVSTQKGREAIKKGWNIVSKEIAKLPKAKLITGAKTVAKAVAAKAANGVAAMGVAVVAGYVTGLTLGDYFKGDAKNFFKQFGQDLALNLSLGPVASAVKHVVVNRDMVAEDIQNNVIKPIAGTLKKIGQKIGIVSKDKTQPNKSLAIHSSPSAQDSMSKQGQSVPQNAVVTPQESGRQVVEYEKNKKGYQPPLKTTADKMVEYMSKRNFNKVRGANTNSPDWYFQGLASKILGTNLTWTGIKDVTDKYDFVSVVGLRCSLTIPMKGKLIHPQIIANNNVEFQALRGKNTGAYNYSEENVYAYDMAISGLIAAVRFTQKVINMSNSFDVQVAKLPVHLYATVFGDSAAQTVYNDVIKNKPNYVTRLNSLAKELNTYAYKGRTLNSRWNYLADKCIRDFNGEKAVYGSYNLVFIPGLDTNGDIDYQKISSCNNVPDLLDYIQTQLTRLRTTKILAGSSAYTKIAGDMIKLLGAKQDTFENVPYINGTEVLKFEFDPEAFDQLRNAKISNATGGSAPSYNGLTPGSIGWSITANSPVSFSAARLADSYYEKDDILIISDRNKEFSAKENIQMVQFQCLIERDATSPMTDPIYYITDCGSSILNNVRVITYTTGSAPVMHDFMGFISMTSSNYLKVNFYSSLYGTAANNYSEWITWLTQIDFMPRMQLCAVDSDVHFYNDFADIDNYAFMSNDQYLMLNNVAVYSQTFTFLPSDVKIVGLVE